MNTEDLKIKVANIIRIMARKKDDCRPKTLVELHHYISRMSDAFNEINILLKIVCTMLATICICE